MAFRTQKISQMTPKGSDLEATDLIEVSTIESGSYVTRSITGQELIDAIPAPTGFVPETRTLTINGTTQDLSANRTFTVSTGITIGTTAITSGTVGRVLFEGTGNVVQESANLFWDNTNGRLGIGTSSPIAGYSLHATSGIKCAYIDTTDGISANASAFSIWNALNNTGKIVFITQASGQQTRMTIANNGNVLINTTTDAGFRLDVNGTARFNGNLKLISGSIFVDAGSVSWGNSRGLLTFSGLDAYVDAAQAGGSLIFRTNGNTDRGRIFSTGNFAINTTTDAGFRLDVNGTARVALKLSVGTPTQASAVMEVTSTTQGFLKPRLTTTQKNAIASPAAGLEVYDTTLNRPCFYDGTTWITL